MSGRERRTVEFRQIRYFCAVAAHRSFSKASAKLHIAQPALSRQIHTLEDELGVALFVRTVRGVEVTEAGRKLQEMGEFLLRYVGEIKPSLAQTASEPSGNVILGLPPSLAFLLAPQLVSEARERYPLLRLRIIEGLSVFLTDWLELGRIDLAVLTDQGPINGIERREITGEDMVFVGAPSLLRPVPRAMKLSEITRFPIMVTHGFRSVLEPWLVSENVEPHYEMELDSIPILKEMLVRGTYCSVVPYSMVADEAQAGRIVAVPFRDPPITRRIVAAFAARRPMSVTMSAVLDLVQDGITKLPTRVPSH
jgi:LysR family transcriptional regulator, nitrogen assimilation regulatory protein